MSTDTLRIEAPYSKIWEGMMHSRLKIEWAKERVRHIQGLVALDCEQSKLRVEVNSQTGRYEIVVGPPTIEMGIPLAAGEVAHHLTASVDYIWSAIARQVKPEFGAKVTFPRHETRTNLSNSLSNGIAAAINQAFPEIDKFILDTIQPYKGGDGNYLWLANQLDRIQKHRMLLTTHAVYGVKESVARNTHGLSIAVSDSTIYTDKKSVIMDAPFPLQIESQAKDSIDIVFGEAEFFTGQPVVETLFNLAKNIDEIHTAFVREFRRRECMALGIAFSPFKFPVITFDERINYGCGPVDPS